MRICSEVHINNVLHCCFDVQCNTVEKSVGQEVEVPVVTTATALRLLPDKNQLKTIRTIQPEKTIRNMAPSTLLIIDAVGYYKLRFVTQRQVVMKRMLLDGMTICPQKATLHCNIRNLSHLSKTLTAQDLYSWKSV